MKPGVSPTENCDISCDTNTPHILVTIYNTRDCSDIFSDIYLSLGKNSFHKSIVYIILFLETTFSV